jgi:4-hydroxy-3-methylbut-2-en-1-yl diphosphate reductase
MTDKINILLANPRGFCAGVDRAIQIVEEALIQYGKPIYVRHEVVHNQYVINDLKTKGAVFIEDLNDVPKGAHVILVRMAFQKLFVKKLSYVSLFLSMRPAHWLPKSMLK